MRWNKYLTKTKMLAKLTTSTKASWNNNAIALSQTPPGILDCLLSLGIVFTSKVRSHNPLNAQPLFGRDSRMRQGLDDR